MQRIIQEHIKKPLAAELLFGKLNNGGNVKITLKGDKLAFDYTSAKKPKKQKSKDEKPLEKT